MNRLAFSLVAWCAFASARPLFVHLPAFTQVDELDALLDAARTVVLSA
jgi:hypothetical protein